MEFEDCHEQCHEPLLHHLDKYEAGQRYINISSINHQLLSTKQSDSLKEVLEMLADHIIELEAES